MASIQYDADALLAYLCMTNQNQDKLGDICELIIRSGKNTVTLSETDIERIGLLKLLERSD